MFTVSYCTGSEVLHVHLVLFFLHVLKSYIFTWSYLQVLKSLQDRFHHIVSQENFPRVAQLVGVKTALITLLESLCGVAEGTRIDNLQRLFTFFLPILQECVKLLGNFSLKQC